MANRNLPGAQFQGGMVDRDHASDKVDDQDDDESNAARDSIPFGL